MRSNWNLAKTKFRLVVEYFQSENEALENMMRGKWEGVSPRRIRPVDGRKENEENERVRGIYTRLQSNRAIDQWDSAANEGYLVGSNSLNFEKGTVSAYLIRNSEFRINSKSHGRRRGEI